MHRKSVKLNYGDLEQLCSLITHGSVWDGDLISKDARNTLVAGGLANRLQGGHNEASPEGRALIQEIYKLIPMPVQMMENEK